MVVVVLEEVFNFLEKVLDVPEEVSEVLDKVPDVLEDISAFNGCFSWWKFSLRTGNLFINVCRIYPNSESTIFQIIIL